MAPPEKPQLASSVPSSVIAWALYDDGVRQPVDELNAAIERAGAGGGFVWMGLKDPSDTEMNDLGARFGLHPLAIEDAVEGHRRSKLEEFGDTLFLVVSTVAYVPHEKLTDASEVVSTGQLMVFLAESFILIVRKGDQSKLDGLRSELEAQPERLRRGPVTVLYAVLDKLIEDYQSVVLEFESDIDEVEAGVFSRQGTGDVDRVYNLKRELIEFKRAVSPLGLPLQLLSHKPLRAIPEGSRAYFRELAEHQTEVKENVLAFDEVLSTILQAGLARASVTDNTDMRKITAVVAIFAVPTLIAGVYGMNFENMPELSAPYGYHLVLAVMAAIMIGLFIGFRKNNWL